MKEKRLPRKIKKQFISKVSYAIGKWDYDGTFYMTVYYKKSYKTQNKTKTFCIWEKDFEKNKCNWLNKKFYDPIREVPKKLVIRASYLNPYLKAMYNIKEQNNENNK